MSSVSPVTPAESLAERESREIRKFATFYYQQPKPQELAAKLEGLLKADVWRQRDFTATDEMMLAYFFARAAHGDPRIVDDYTKLFEGVMHRQRLFILQVLRLCGNEATREYFRARVAAGRFGNERPEIQGLLRGVPYEFDVMAKPAVSVAALWILMTEFTTTGDEAAIPRIIDALTYQGKKLTMLSPEDPRHPSNVQAAAKKFLEVGCRLHPRVLDVCKGECQKAKGETREKLEEIIESADGSISEQRWAENPPPDKPVTGAGGWAIASAAVLVEMNYECHDTLSIHPITHKSIRSEKEALDEWWGIKNKGDLLENLEWLKSGGHRAYFEKTGKYVDGLTDHEFEELLKRCENDNEKKQEYTIARQYYRQLGSRSILGWDHSRYIYLCRAGYAVGFLSEDEAWQNIMPIARVLQEKFDSWEDLGRNYVIGRKFWSYEHTVKTGADCEDAFQRLLDMKSSPWNNYPWDMDLDEVPAQGQAGPSQAERQSKTPDDVNGGAGQ